MTHVMWLTVLAHRAASLACSSALRDAASSSHNGRAAPASALRPAGAPGAEARRRHEGHAEAGRERWYENGWAIRGGSCGCLPCGRKAELGREVFATDLRRSVEEEQQGGAAVALDGRDRSGCARGVSPCDGAAVFLLRAFGDPRRGSSGEYTEALRQGTTVTLLISEVTGARHSLGERFLRSCAAAYAERHPTAAGPSADRSFYSLHSSFLSTASLRGLGRQLRTKVLSSVSASSLRRRVPTCSSSPPLGHPAPRAGGRSFC
ncbi:hypothetical protein AB1Y20_003245 [Prymnesium parvum]|uniref:Uncharacterized protein n=1 Tax=Prymnesium parvum TaxID=97485 RepID=A0AB34JBD4_PRYPA